MSISRFLALGSIAALLLLASCGKTEKNEETKPVEKKEVKKAEKNPDLFDEYYEDEKKADEPADEKSSTEELSTETTEPVESDSKPTESKLIEEVTEDKSGEAEKTEPDFDPNGRYVAQISCIASEAIAEDVAKKLENSGYPVYVAEVINPTPQLLGTYYRVRVGGFATISAAKYFGENFLLPAGYSYWVDNRSNDNVGIGDYGLGTTSTSMFEDEPATEVKTTTTPVDNSSDFTVEPVTNTEVKEVVDEVKAVVDTVVTTVKETVDPVVTTTTDESTTTPDESTTTPDESTTTPDESTTTNSDDWGSSDW